MKSLLKPLEAISPKHKEEAEINVLGEEKEEATDADAESYLLSLQNDTADLCKKLDQDVDLFVPQEFFNAIYTYVKNDNRLVYSSITTYIFSIVPEKNKVSEHKDREGSIVSNLRCVIDYANGNEFQANNSDKEPEAIVLTKKYLLKFWDHVNLAQRQYEQIAKEEEYFNALAKKSVEEATKPIAAELNRELISLVGIFTALSFLVFGGVSSLDNIFDGAKNIPLLKLLIVGSVWGICMINLIFIFIFFIAKLTGISIKSDNSGNANIVKRYPIIFFTNWLLVTVLAYSIWSYWFIKLNLWGNTITFWIFTIPIFAFYNIIIGFFVVVIFLIILHAYTKVDKESFYNKNSDV